MCDKLNNENVT